jgi:hypothetical protein
LLVAAKLGCMFLGRIRIEEVSYYRLGYLHIVRPGHAAIEKAADPRALLAVTARVSVRRRSIFWRICCTPALHRSPLPSG